MNIIFLSRYDVSDINNWSGTLFHIYHQLKKRHNVEVVGTELLNQLTAFRKGNFQNDFFVDSCRYVKKIGSLLSERINLLDYDLLFFGDLLLHPCNINIPFVHFSDMTYDQVNMHLKKSDERNVESAIHQEKFILDNTFRIIYSSEWIKSKAIEVYNINPDKIDVVELGANIPTPTNYTVDIGMDVCRLVFIGRDWEKKGGDKVLQAYRILSAGGFPCSLTIIGSEPKEYLEADENITIIPFLDKTKPEHLKILCSILSVSHFLVLPTEFDAYGIVFCEASAYAVPSIAANVGGVSQPVREGKNGFLLSADATALEYAEKIRTVFQDRENYIRLRTSSRHEFETRLNWDVWSERVNKILEDTVKEWKEHKNQSNK
ncbi:MAG: glycosyltransferase family 4 protein [Bacteroidales bacterium]|jgi:glycosyltransferase involved in cell wall biosynthesis|nr:glycosyltransferase family 4 protein [Bacteroidales bacterium]